MEGKLIRLCTAMALVVGCSHQKMFEAKQDQPAAQPAAAVPQPESAPASVAAEPAKPPESQGLITITTSSAEAADAYVEGVDWLLAGHQDKGLVFLRKALQFDPNLLVAQAMLNHNTPGAEAMQKVDEAAQASTSLPEAERTEIEAIDAAKHGDYEKARELELKLLSLAPRDWRAHAYVCATAFFLAHRTEEAARHLREAASLNPKAIGPWSILGVIAEDQGNKAEAVEAQESGRDEARRSCRASRLFVCADLRRQAGGGGRGSAQSCGASSRGRQAVGSAGQRQGARIVQYVRE